MFAVNKYLKQVLLFSFLSLSASVYALSPPAGDWKETWGAIAPSDKDNIFGAAVGEDSKQEAEQIALADCKARGGAACKVELAYQNQCIAMVTGKKQFKLKSADSIAAATQQAMADCQQDDTACRVAYSVCTLMRFVPY